MSCHTVVKPIPVPDTFFQRQQEIDRNFYRAVTIYGEKIRHRQPDPLMSYICYFDKCSRKKFVAGVFCFVIGIALIGMGASPDVNSGLGDKASAGLIIVGGCMVAGTAAMVFKNCVYDRPL